MSLVSGVEDNLKRLGIKYTTREVKYLVNRDRSGYLILTNPNVPFAVARSIIASATSALTSRHRKSIQVAHGYVLDGPISVQGQAKVIERVVLGTIQT